MVLREEILKLAAENPSLRKHLVPLVREAANFSPPVDVKTQKGAKAWIAEIRNAILSAKPSSPEREKLIKEAEKQINYGVYLAQKNKSVVKFYEDELKKIKDLKDTHD